MHDINIFFFFFRYNDARGEGGGSLRPRMSVLRMATAETNFIESNKIGRKTKHDDERVKRE